MNAILFGMLFLIFVVSACENVDVSQISDEDLERISEKAVVCNKPYMRLGTECCLDRDNNAICDSDEVQETQLSETEVVETFVENFFDAQNIDEHITATKASLRYVTGYAKDYYSQQIPHLKEMNEQFNEFYNGLWVKCTEVRTENECIQSQKQFLDSFNSAFKKDSRIIIVELKEDLDDRKVIHVEIEKTTPEKKQTVVVDYFVKEENGEWKIYDFIDKEGKLSDVPLEEVRVQNQESLKKLKATYDESLKIFEVGLEKVGEKDKCSYLDETTGLTAAELEYELEICYQGKYINYAMAINNTSVCEEIVSPSYYSLCIAAVASQKNDIGLCNQATYEEWEAKGYFEKINTKDVCYYGFVAYKYNDMDSSQAEEACNKISNVQIKAQCLQLKELSSLYSGLFDSKEETTEERHLEIISHNDKTEYGYLYITGEVKNTGNTTAESVKITAKFYKNDEFVDRDYTYADSLDIQSGETDTFEIMWKIQDYDRYEVIVN